MLSQAEERRIKMYSVNDTVLYGVDGVCRIDSISEQKFGRETMKYYVLKPIFDQNATIFVPFNNEALTGKIRRILSVKEIHELIRSIPEEQPIWNDNEQERQEEYRSIISSGDRVNLIRIIKALYREQQKKKENGKRLHSADERFMREAEKLLYEEFAYVLKIKRDQVVPFINEQISILEKHA